MGVKITPLVSELRQGPEFHDFGDDWTRSAVLLHLSPEEVQVRLARSEGLALRPWCEIRKAMRAAGIRVVRYQRYRRGKITETEIRL